MRTLEIKSARWLSLWFLKTNGYWAITLPTGIYVLEEHMGKDWLIRHERKHEEQAARHGWLVFLARYFWYQIRHGYNNNPFEIEAREAEHRV